MSCKFGHTSPPPPGLWVQEGDRYARQHEAVQQKYQFNGNVWRYLTKRTSSSVNQLSSHTWLAITHARLVQTRLQMENSLDKSKLHMVPSMLTVSKEIPAAFPPTVGPLLPYTQSAQLYVSYILIFSILPDSSAEFVTLGRDSMHTATGAAAVCLALAAKDPFPILLHLGNQGSHFQNPLRKHFANSNTVWNRKQQKLP